MTAEQITARIAALKAELEQLIAEANRQIGVFQGRIAENERLLAELQPVQTETTL